MQRFRRTLASYIGYVYIVKALSCILDLDLRPNTAIKLYSLKVKGKEAVCTNYLAYDNDPSAIHHIDGKYRDKWMRQVVDAMYCLHFHFVT